MNNNSNAQRTATKAFRAIVLVSSLMLAVFPATAPRAQAQTPAAKPDAAQTTAKPSDSKQTTPKPSAEIPADAAAQANAVALRALPAKGKRYALIIGVDKYADTQITTLGGASNDARALSDALIRYAGFPADQVILLASDQPAERQPTRGNILRRLSNLATDFPKDGLLLFSFAGHGMERSGQAFLLPSDAQVSDDVSLLEQTAVNVQIVKDWVKKSGVRQVLLLLDACRNDPGGRAEADNPLTETYTRGFNFSTRNREIEAFVTLYATTIGKRAYEYKEKKQGYFTWALVEGLKGAAANEKGEVTLDGLVNYIQDRVPKQVRLDLGAGKVQRPFAVIEGYKADELVLSVGGERGLAIGQTAIGDIDLTPSVEEGNNTGSRTTSYYDVEGTTWTARPLYGGTTVIEFQKGGKLLYTLIPDRGDPKPPLHGSWNQEGKSISIDNRYSVLECMFDEGVVRCDGENVEGVKFKLTFYPKRP
ncbi:MAG: caspase family protein [Rubrivivax sp.]|nr:caspase family protein [Pyrinomonadaceae bacterium]